jgi:hypothetical protein
MSVIQVLNDIQSEVQGVLKDTFSEKGPGSITCQVNAKVLKIINNSGLEKIAAGASDKDIKKIADMFTHNINLMNKAVDNIKCDIKKGGAKSRSKKGGDNVSPSDFFFVGENKSSKSGGARGGMPRASRRRAQQQQQEDSEDEDESESEEENGPPQTPVMFPGNGQSTGTGFGFGNTNPNAANNPFSNNTQTPSTNTQTPSNNNQASAADFENRTRAYPTNHTQLIRRPEVVNAVQPLDQQLMDGAMEAVSALDNYDFMAMTYLTLLTGTLHYTGSIAATIDYAIGAVGSMIGLTPLDTVCGIGSNAARRHAAGWITLGPECQVAQGQWEVLILGMAVMTTTLLIIISARSSRRIAATTRSASASTVVMELSMTGVTVLANQLRGCERGEESPPLEERSSIMQMLISPINGLANLSGRMFRAAGGLFRSIPQLVMTQPNNQTQAITSVAAPTPVAAATATATATPTPIGRTTGTNNGRVAQSQMSEDDLRAARIARFDNGNSTGGRNKRRTRRRKSKASKKQRKTRRKISKKARKTKKAKKSKKSKKAKKSRKSKK